MNLVFLHGPAAVGKLTVARELSKLTGYRIFHNHLIVDALTPVFEFGSEPFVRLREAMWLSVFGEAGRQGISSIFTFAPERTVSPSFIDDAIAAVEEAGGRILFVELVCETGELERRVEDASRERYGKLQSLELFRKLRRDGAFEYPVLPSSGLTIDTRELTPAEAAQRICRFFELP